MLGHLPELLGRSVLRDSIWVHSNFKERTWRHFQERRGFVLLLPFSSGQGGSEATGPSPDVSGAFQGLRPHEPKPAIPWAGPWVPIHNSLHSASVTFRVPMGRFKQLFTLGKGGDVRPGRNKQSRADLGTVLFLHHRVHTTMSLSCSADTESHSRWEKLTINRGMLPTSMQTPGWLDLKVDDVDSYLPHQPPLRRMPS